MMDQGCFQAYRSRAEEGLNRLITGEKWQAIPQPLRDAMAYSLLSGGKRLRPVLLLAAHELLKPAGDTVLRFAAALEMIHTYSLIHDDLPAMDNDTMRRGKPTCHVVYGEGMAILAGDALLSLAMEELFTAQTLPEIRAARLIATAAGPNGMVAGQCLDLTHAGEAPTEELVAAIDRLKTGCLLTSPILAGLTLAGADEAQLAAGQVFGDCFGVAFQIQDDLLDLTGDEKTLGKHTGKDQAEGKLTWPAALGVEKAREDMKRLTERACEALSAAFGDRAAFLNSLAQECVERSA